jgi:hypothetical protein
MAVPVQKVEFGFTQSSPGVYTYLDITSYVRSVSISRGVSRETDAYQAGTCSIVLDNNQRAFDPSYSSSPFYGQVKPQAAVRVTVGNVVVFTGFVDNWSFDYQIVADATATIQASDATGRISRASLPAITWTSELSSTRVTNVLNRAEVAWPASQRQISLGSLTLGADTVSDGTSAWDYLQQVAQSEGGACFVTGTGDVAFKGQSASLVPTSATAYRYNLSLNPSAETNTTGYSGATRVSTQAYVGTYSLQGSTFTEWDVLPPVAGDTLNGLRYADSATTFVSNTAYTFSCYVYSTVAQTATLTGGFKRTSAPAKLDASYSTVSLAANTWTRMSVTATPSSSAATGNLSIEVPGAGTTVFVDAVLIEASPYLNVYFDGTSKPANTASITYTNAWQGTTNNSASTLTIVTSYSPSTPNGLVVGDAGGTAIPYEDVQVIYASETLYTNTSIGVAGTANATQANAANGSAYGIRTLTIDPSLVADTTNGQALANYYLDIYDNPQLRFDSVTFGLSGLSAVNQVSVLNSEIYTAVSMTYTPSALGSAITAYQRVVGISHTITPDSHKVTLNLAEFGTRFRLDSVTYGFLNTNILGY